MRRKIFLRTPMIKRTYEKSIDTEDMVLDITLQAIPHNCTLVEASLTEPGIGEYLELLGFAEVSFEHLKFKAGDEAFVFYLAEAKAIREANYGIENRRLNLGQRWEMLLYALSDDRHLGMSVDTSSWQNRAINGGDTLGVSVCSTSGIPIRMVSPNETKMIASEFALIDLDDLAAHLVSHEMAAANVYANNSGWAGTRIETVMRDLEKLADLYAVAAENDEGILVFCT